ncbi:MAG TPA: hypothetical protein VD858_09560 [Reyranella sp.]|nr:hypothetical protein [Reyranella sp.]
MNFEIAAAALSPTAATVPDTAGGPVQGGYGISLTDFGNFEQSMVQAGMRLEAQPATGPTEAARQLMKPFEHINGEAQRLSLDAKAADGADRQMSPSEMVSLNVRCQEFSFHCQLMSNIANRTSDGLQQLFRQQS